MDCDVRLFGMLQRGYQSFNGLDSKAQSQNSLNKLMKASTRSGI